MKKINSSVLITGVTRGIGKHFAEKMIQEGYIVYGIYKERDDLAKKLEEKHKNAIFTFKVDLEDRSQIETFLRAFKRDRKKLDILINNAGIYIGGGVKTLELDLLDHILRVNLTSKFLLIKELLPLLKKSNIAKIINISSRFGFLGHSSSEDLAYNITNSSIIMMTSAMQKDLKKDNIKIGCFIPTVTSTDRFYEAFSDLEQKEVLENGMLASEEDTANKLYMYLNEMEGDEIFIDKRANSGHLQCLKLNIA